MQRTINIDRAKASKESGDLVIEMAFATEIPYERWWGIEILDMDKDSVRLGRLNDGAAVLFNHNMDDLRGTHVKNSARIDGDRVLRGHVRITSETQLGRDAIRLIETDVLTKSSVGYSIHYVVEEGKTKRGDPFRREIDGRAFEGMLKRAHETGKTGRREFYRLLDTSFGHVDRADDDISTFRVMDWEPFENSLVTIPADNAAGIGRSDTEFEARILRASQPAVPAEGATMGDLSTATGADTAGQGIAPTPGAVEIEKGRVRAIENLCRANQLDEKYREHWVGTGASIEQVSEDILKILEERGKRNPQPASRLGLGRAETRNFSLMRAIRAMAEKDWTHAGFELECSNAVAKRLNQVPNPTKLYVPFEVMQRDIDSAAVADLRERMGIGRRDLTVATAGAGGYLVSTDNVGFIEILRNRSVAFRMGARRLSGLTGNVTVPRQSAAATAYWLANEAATITESQQTFVQMALTPKSVGAYTEISRQLLLQSSPGAEGIVSDDLAQQVALAADLAVLEGSGASGQPTGISNTAGIGSVTGTSIDYAKVLEFQTDVAGSNVMPARGGYVTTPAVAALLMQRSRFSNTDTPLWVGNVWDGTVAGFPAMSSNQPTAATMLFGDFSEVVVGEWGVLEIEVNPFSNFPAGIVGVRAIYSIDVGVRRPFAFSRATSIT